MEKRLQHFQVPYSRFTVPGTKAAQLFLLDVEGEALAVLLRGVVICRDREKQP